MSTPRAKPEGNGRGRSVRQLERKIAALSKALDRERLLRKRLKGRQLPLCPKHLEKLIPTPAEAKKLAQKQPSILELIDSLT